MCPLFFVLWVLRASPVEERAADTMPPQQDLLAPFRSRSGYEGSSLVKLLHGERENILSDLREHLQCVDSDRWGLDLQVWEGPLQGVVHQKGHFPQLEEAPAEEAVAKTDGVAAGDAEVGPRHTGSGTLGPGVCEAASIIGCPLCPLSLLSGGRWVWRKTPAGGQAVAARQKGHAPACNHMGLHCSSL